MKSKDELFNELFNKYNNKIHRLCLAITHDNNDALDLMQDVYCKIWINLPHFRNESDIFTWIYRITVNTFLSTKTKRKLNNEYLEVNFIQNKIEIDDSNKLIMSVRACIACLKNDVDKIVVGLFLEGMSYKEISYITGLSINLVGVKLNRIKDQLRKCFSE